MGKLCQILIMMPGIVAAACATQNLNRNINTAAGTLPVKHIYVVIAADPLVSANPGYLSGMAKFKKLLRDKIQKDYPATEVVFRHPIEGSSTGWEMMIDVLDFNYVSRGRRFSGDSYSGNSRLRVHIQLTDVRNRKTFDDYILGAAPDYPTDKVQVTTTDVSTGGYSMAAEVGNSFSSTTTSQLMYKVSMDIAATLGRQAVAMHHP